MRQSVLREILFNRIFLLTLLLVFKSTHLTGQDQLVIPRLSGPINFDGLIDEPAWNEIQPLPMVTHSPVFGKEPSEKTEIRITNNNEYIYVSARLFDTDPSKIMSTSKKRDEVSSGNDWFTVFFDSFNDKENGLIFSTTPSGLRCDYSVFKDAIVQLPETPFNINWNTFWDVKTSRDDKGWYVEMRIPVSSMRFKENNGNTLMGLICIRHIARKNEIDVFPPIPPDWGVYSVYRPSQSKEIIFQGIHSKRPFYIAPHVIGGYQQENILNDLETDYDLKEEPKLNGGLDIKYGLTNNLTLDVTVNTDFAQVEADDEQINLTRFSLFYPEKRSFFQERSSIFSFDFDEGNHLFYTRRIGLSNGEIVPLYGGTRITGMIGKWDIGFLDMQTRKYSSDEDSSNNLPSENFGILRMRRNILNENSYIGGIGISRIGFDGQYNFSYGMDATIKIFDDDYLNVKLSQVMDDSVSNKPLSLNPSQLYFNWKRFRNKGFGYDFTYARSGKDFESGTGFRMRDDYSFYSGSLNYGWMHSESSSIMNDGIEMNARNYRSNEMNETESLFLNVGHYFVLKSGMFSYSGLNHQFENVVDSFSFSDYAYILPGKYHFNLLELHGETSQSRTFFCGWDMYTGSFYDGNRFSVSVHPYWNVNSSLQFSAVYGYDRLRFHKRNQQFDGHIFRFRTVLMLSTSFSISAFIQYNNTDNNVIGNLRLRYNPKEGNDFYIVYNEGRNTSLDMEIPRPPSLNNRALLLKYTYTFSARK